MTAVTDGFDTLLGETTDKVGEVRVAIHDASRLEWSFSVPLPEDGSLDYELKVQLRIPASVFVRHEPWEMMQAFTRLDGPAHVGSALTVDALRRGALATVAQLSRASDGFKRHMALTEDDEPGLVLWLDAAQRTSDDARRRFAVIGENEADELSRERVLVDEYISVRLLEMLAAACRVLGERPLPVVEERVAEMLAQELAHRAEMGLPNAHPNDAESLAHYLDRSSRLKKHFQEVLFLEPESYKVADRAYHWIAAFVAVLASTWAFAWQLALAQRATTSTIWSSGFITVALIAGIVYAGKDRIKEIGRNWMTHRVHRVWGAQRITRYRAPARRIPARDIIVTAKESFAQELVQEADPLNPEVGVTRPVMVIRYEHNGTVVPNAKLTAAGVGRVKHVFRYDFSPHFARLDDATKPVPVLDAAARKIRFVDAPRVYHFPLHVEVSCGKEKSAEDATLIVTKKGLERVSDSQ